MSQDFSIIHLLLNASWVVQLVVLLLMVMSAVLLGLPSVRLLAPAAKITVEDSGKVRLLEKLSP